MYASVNFPTFQDQSTSFNVISYFSRPHITIVHIVICIICIMCRVILVSNGFVFTYLINCTHSINTHLNHCKREMSLSTQLVNVHKNTCKSQLHMDKAQTCVACALTNKLPAETVLAEIIRQYMCI